MSSFAWLTRFFLISLGRTFGSSPKSISIPEDGRGELQFATESGHFQGSVGQCVSSFNEEGLERRRLIILLIPCCRAAPPLDTLPTTALDNDCWQQEGQINTLVRTPTHFLKFPRHLYVYPNSPSSRSNSSWTLLTTNSSICQVRTRATMTLTLRPPSSRLLQITQENMASSCVSKNLELQSPSHPPWVDPGPISQTLKDRWDYVFDVFKWTGFQNDSRWIR